jgi:hypothetical protein
MSSEFSTTNTDIPILDISNLVMDPDQEVPNTSQTILDDEETNFYSTSNKQTQYQFMQIATKTEINTFQHNHTWDMVNRPADRQIVNSKWISKIKHLIDGSENKFKV